MNKSNMSTEKQMTEDGRADKARLKAKMDGAFAALEGRKLDANQYPEESELHFDWLAGWTSAKMEMRKTPNGKISDGGGL